jgi:hypothetical protein
MLWQTAQMLLLVAPASMHEPIAVGASSTELEVLEPSAAAQDPVAVDAPVAEAEGWEFSGNVYYSDPPGSEDRLTTIVYADRGPLHLEARYNYEDLETGSLFAGWTFALADDSEGELGFDLTPMLGVVAGETDGIAPALEADLGWRRLSWYAEMEYLFDTDDRDDDFFYSWSTLLYDLTDWMSAGVVTERSKLVDTDYSLQHGLALEFTRERWACTRCSSCSRTGS